MSTAILTCPRTGPSTDFWTVILLGNARWAHSIGARIVGVCMDIWFSLDSSFCSYAS